MNYIADGVMSTVGFVSGAAGIPVAATVGAQAAVYTGVLCGCLNSDSKLGKGMVFGALAGATVLVAGGGLLATAAAGSIGCSTALATGLKVGAVVSGILFAAIEVLPDAQKKPKSASSVDQQMIDDEADKARSCNRSKWYGIGTLVGSGVALATGWKTCATVALWSGVFVARKVVSYGVKG